MRYQVSKPVLAGRERDYVLDAVESGWISSNGAYIARFEAAIAGLLGVDECIAVSNGTVALHVACLALGLKPGDEVVIPSLTYVATANAVAYCGARPVFADADTTTWNATAAQITDAITERTVGVIAVHLYGLPGPIEEIRALCDRRGLWLIEDCAESLGADVHGRMTGTFGDAATFSFYGNKTISTGEGGAVVLRDPQRRRLGRMLRGQGMDPARRYWHPIIGYNYRMTNVAAAIGLGQIEMADYHIGERRRIARCYADSLKDLAEEGEIALPAEVPGHRSTYWLFSTVLRRGGATRRAAIEEILRSEHGIETRPFFVPMHRLPMYETATDRLAGAEYLGSHGMNLPSYSGLADDSIREISAALAAAIRRTR